MNGRTAIVAGLGAGLGEALTRKLVTAGYRAAGLARSPQKARHLEEELNRSETVFLGVPCDVSDPGSVAEAVARVRDEFGEVSVYVHNAAQLILKPFLDTTTGEFESLWRVICLGGVNGAHAVLPDMPRRGSGVILFIGATASIKGGARSAAFSSAKFALRGLSQSLARAHGPDGVHVAHLLVDGVIWGERARAEFAMTESQCLAPEAVAESCLQLIGQDRSAWTLEQDLRPSVESF